MDPIDSTQIMIVSSDGHAAAQMEDYRPYLDPKLREEFDAFCVVYAREGSKNSDPVALRGRLDPEEVDRWVANVIEPGRLDGLWDPRTRLSILESEGVVGEVLFPDTCLPFELNNPGLAAVRKSRPPTAEQIDGARRAYNRWLADFVSYDPARFAAMALVGFDDVDAALKEIRWAKGAGFSGVIVPKFDESSPLFEPRYDPIWSLLEELDMPLNSHISLSATSTRPFPEVQVPHPGVARRLTADMLQFFCIQVLDHMIWGGVMDRHPGLRLVLTEQGSGWVPGRLAAMDYSYSGSYLRRDIREVVRRPPSEYFKEQCWLGSSLLTRDEVANRDIIGVDKMMIGIDYPHHEGAWWGPTVDYLRATFGAARVPAKPAKAMLGETAVEVFGFDREALSAVVERCALRVTEVLTPPIEDRFPRGDVHKPMAGAIV